MSYKGTFFYSDQDEKKLNPEAKRLKVLKCTKYQAEFMKKKKNSTKDLLFEKNYLIFGL